MQKFIERDTEELFPEFSHLPGNVTWMDFRRCHGTLRATVLSCDNGYIRYCITNETTSTLLSFHEVDIDGPSLSVKVFPLVEPCPSPYGITGSASAIAAADIVPCYSHSLQLLVTSALDLSVIFRNPGIDGFSNMLVLPQSDHHDAVTCSLIADVDCDGNNEVILGTYGQELLVYKWRRQTETDSLHFDLLWQCSFSQPIFALQQLDLIGDGMKELAVATMTSVHIMQRDVSTSIQMLLDKHIKHGHQVAIPKSEREDEKEEEH